MFLIDIGVFMKNLQDVEVDAVVMWVDQNDPSYSSMQEIKKDTPKNKKINDGVWRYRNSGELKYCLRSIEENLPWVRKIYIVTNGQRPNFIDFTCDKIELVSHKEILDEEYLPTFNSFAIDSALHNINGLSERFVRFSDDYIIGCPVSKEDVLGESGYGVQYLKDRVPESNLNASFFYRILQYSKEVVEHAYGRPALHAFPHIPQLRSVSQLRAYEEKIADYLKATRASKFRAIENVSTIFSYPYHIINSVYDADYDDKEKISHPDVCHHMWKHHRKINIGEATGAWVDKLQAAFEENVKYICINDAFGHEVEKKDLEVFVDIMESRFFNPASFEVV